MGRRYGRNQKRRHREEIARLKLETAKQLHSLHDAGRERNRAMAELRDIEQRLRMFLPHNSALFPPRETVPDRPDLVVHQMPDPTAWDERPGKYVTLDATPHIRLRKLLLHVEKDLQRFRRCVHLRLDPGLPKHCAGSTFGYAISEDAWEMMMRNKPGQREAFVRTIGEQIAAMIWKGMHE